MRFAQKIGTSPSVGFFRIWTSEAYFSKGIADRDLNLSPSVGQLHKLSNDTQLGHLVENLFFGLFFAKNQIDHYRAKLGVV